jgi:hypothetical protein
MHKNPSASGFSDAGEAQQGQKSDDANHVLGLREYGGRDSITAINFSDRVKVENQAGHRAKAASVNAHTSSEFLG